MLRSSGERVTALKNPDLSFQNHKTQSTARYKEIQVKVRKDERKRLALIAVE